jgi:hypothetical protein
VLDSTSNTALAAGALIAGAVVTRTELGAKPNLEGLEASEQAGEALKGLVPRVDWAAEAKAREQPDLDLTPRSGKMIPWLIAGGAALVVIILILAT